MAHACCEAPYPAGQVAAKCHATCPSPRRRSSRATGSCCGAPTRLAARLLHALGIGDAARLLVAEELAVWRCRDVAEAARPHSELTLVEPLGEPAALAALAVPPNGHGPQKLLPGLRGPALALHPDLDQFPDHIPHTSLSHH